MRVGIIGFGLAGEVFHAPLVDATEGLEVAGIVTGDPGRAAHAAEQFPQARVVPRAEDLWEHVDLVVVATPNRAHVPLALEAIRRDLPVVVDKPLAPTAAEAERLLEAGGRVTVFQNRRWDGDFLTVRRLIEDGALGEVTRLESRFERFRPQLKAGWRESGAPEEGGGQLLDLGAHLVDQALLLFGLPDRVYAEVDTRRLLAEVEDDVFLSLEHRGGVRVHLWMGAVAPLVGPRFRVSGLGGGFACDGLDPQESQLRLGRRPGDPGFGEREPGSLVRLDGLLDDVPMERGRYEDFYAGVRAWAQDGAPPPVEPVDSLAGLRVLEAARLSGRERTVVDLSW